MNRSFLQENLLTASFPFSGWGWRPLPPEWDRYKFHKNVPSSFGVFPRFRRHTSCHFLINCYMEVAERQAWLNRTKGSHAMAETLPGWVRSAGVWVSGTVVILCGTLDKLFPSPGLLSLHLQNEKKIFMFPFTGSILKSWDTWARSCPQRVLGQDRAARKGLLMDGDAEQRKDKSKWKERLLQMYSRQIIVDVCKDLPRWRRECQEVLWVITILREADACADVKCLA